jgi:predicted metalloprotease with PDZ domain
MRLAGFDVVPAAGAWAALAPATASGVVVSRTRAGNTDFFPGDVIVAVDTTHVAAADALMAVLSVPGAHAITRVRKGRVAQVRVAYGQALDAGAQAGARSTASGTPLPPEITMQSSADGVTLSNVPDNSALYRAGIRNGDFVVQVAGGTATTRSITSALARADRDTILIVVRRRDVLTAHLLAPSKTAQ